MSSVIGAAYTYSEYTELLSCDSGKEIAPLETDIPTLVKIQ